MNGMKYFFVFLILLLSQNGRTAPLTYDLGVSSGTYGGYSYTEMHLGLNWYFWDYFNWRNSAFSRYGSQIDKASGLDTSLRFEIQDKDDWFGYHFFVGPGYRFSSASNSAIFGEAGTTIKLGSLNVGVGVKYLSYQNPGTSSSGEAMPKNDTNVFLIIAGGGAL